MSLSLMVLCALKSIFSEIKVVTPTYFYLFVSIVYLSTFIYFQPIWFYI